MVLELAGDINIVICTVFHLHKKLNRDIEDKDLNQTFWNEKLQYLRWEIIWRKKINGRLDIIEEKISAFEDISIETI